MGDERHSTRVQRKRPARHIEKKLHLERQTRHARARRKSRVESRRRHMCDQGRIQAELSALTQDRTWRTTGGGFPAKVQLASRARCARYKSLHTQPSFGAMEIVNSIKTNIDTVLNTKTNKMMMTGEKKRYKWYLHEVSKSDK